MKTYSLIKDIAVILFYFSLPVLVIGGIFLIATTLLSSLIGWFGLVGGIVLFMMLFGN